MNKAGSYRTGWNSRGGSVKDDLEAARDFWEHQARQKAQTLKGWLGADYATFEEMIFPGETFDRMSWQQVASTVDNWIASGKDVIMDSLECTCRPDGAACPVCAAKARVRERDA